MSEPAPHQLMATETTDTLDWIAVCNCGWRSEPESARPLAREGFVKHLFDLANSPTEIHVPALFAAQAALLKASEKEKHQAQSQVEVLEAENAELRERLTSVEGSYDRMKVARSKALGAVSLQRERADKLQVELDDWKDRADDLLEQREQLEGDVDRLRDELQSQEEAKATARWWRDKEKQRADDNALVIRCERANLKASNERADKLMTQCVKADQRAEKLEKALTRIADADVPPKEPFARSAFVSEQWFEFRDIACVALEEAKAEKRRGAG